MADEVRYNQLRRKFHGALLEMDRQKVRLIDLEMRNNKLYLRAEAPSREAMNFVWDEIRAIDPDLVDVTAEITIGQGQTGNERAADREIARTTAPDPNEVAQGGDRHTGTGTA